MIRAGYIYTLSEPNSDIVRYVGQTVNAEKRYNLHLFHSKNGLARTHKEKWINSLMKAGEKPEMNIIWEGDCNELDKQETIFIQMFKAVGARLTNSTMGGLTTRGRKCSDETKKKLSDLLRGRCLRPPITEAEKIALSKRKKGVKMPDAQRKKLSESCLGRPSFWTNNTMPEAYLKRIAETGRAFSKAIVAFRDGKEYYFPSTVEAEQITGCDRKTMRLVANGVYKQCKGYIFKWFNN